MAGSGTRRYESNHNPSAPRHTLSLSLSLTHTHHRRHQHAHRCTHAVHVPGTRAATCTRGISPGGYVTARARCAAWVARATRVNLTLTPTPNPNP
eukprot:scaffold19056_cov36-Phaeocystis_antarctica.AAC.1